MKTTTLWAFALSAGLLFPGFAFAGIDGSSGKITSAISSGSVDAIVAELERSENIPQRGAFDAVMKLVDHDSERVREAAGWWLGRRAMRQQLVALAEVRLNAQDPIAARNVLDALRGMRDSTNLDLVAGYLAHPLDEDSGVAAARTIGAFGSPRGLSALGTATASSLAGVRAQALRAVRELRAPIGQKVIADGTAFLTLLKDGNETVRREAALTLGFLGQRGLNPDPVSSGVNALIDALQNDASARVRKAAAWALGEIGNAAGRDALRAATKDADSQVRSIANAAVARLF